MYPSLIGQKNLSKAASILLAGFVSCSSHAEVPPPLATEPTTTNTAKTEMETVDIKATTTTANIETNTQPLTPSLRGFFNSYKAAELHDYQLRRAFHTYQADQEEDNISKSALLPKVSVSANYQYEDSDNIYTDEDSSFYSESQERSGGELIDYSYNFNIRQAIINMPALEDYRSSQALVEAAGYNYQQAQQELIYRVSEHYLKVLLAAQQVYLNEQKLESLELKQAQVERAKALKISDQLSLLHAKANRDIAHSDLLQAKGQLRDAKTLLSNITGSPVEPPSNFDEGYDLTPNLITGTLDDWLKDVNNNMNVKAARARADQEHHSLLARKKESLPKLSLTLSHRDRESDDDFRSRSDAIAAIELSMPLYTGDLIPANTRKAKARFLASQAELDYIRAEKQQQIKLSYDRLSSFKDRLLALAKSKKSSQGFLEAAERQQSLKLSSQITVLEARTQLLDTQLQFARTLNDYLLADLILRLETGRLNEARLHEYDQLFRLSEKITEQ